MPKSQRILDLFPACYRAFESTKLLHEVVRVLAQPMEEIDAHLFRIQRAHRVNVAEHIEDIIRLAALLDLNANQFADITDDDSLAYDQKLELLRSRVKRVASVHLDGLGTPWAILESAAAFLNATIVPDTAGQPVKHIDADGFSHRVTIEFGHLADRPREQIQLHENPFRRRKLQPFEAWQLNSWKTHNRNFEDSPLKIVVRGIGRRTVLPSVFCAETGEGMLFNGVIPDGQRLVIDPDNGATLEGKSVDRFMIRFRGGIHDFADADVSPYVVQDSSTDARFDGNLAQLTVSPVRGRTEGATVRKGKSTWHFKVAEGNYDANDFDYSVFATHRAPIGVFGADFSFDECLYDFPASGEVGSAWNERIPCSFKLLLPPDLPADGTDDQGKATNHVSRVAAILPRFKAAGIRGYVDAAKHAWVLGHSVVRSADAQDGKGLESHATRLWNQNSDIIVPLESRA